MSQQLFAGFARADISPTVCSVPLGGFGATEHRLSGVIGEPLSVNAVALRSGEETMVYLSMDVLGLPAERVAQFREAITEKTGLPKDRIILGASHTHSGPDLFSMLPCAVRYRDEQLTPALVSSALRALTDLKPAKLSYGSIEVGKPDCRMGFDRHYYVVEKGKEDDCKEEDKYFADFTHPKYWKDKENYSFVEHLMRDDPMLQILRFERDGADDIVFFSFTAHSTFVGTNRGTLVSPDWPGATVQRIEMLFPGTKCAFLQGCCGNIVPETKIESEGLLGLTTGPDCDCHAYAAVIGGYARRLLKKRMRESETTELKTLQCMLPCRFDHSRDDQLARAEAALAIFRKEGHTQAARELCFSHGFESLYPALAILRRAALPEIREVELNAIRIGDCAIATFPFESYCDSGLRVKAASPFALTVANGYCCGYHSYLPTLDAHRDSYEWSQMLFEPGTAEKVEAKLSEMLNKLK